MLDQIIQRLGKRFGAVEIIPIYTKPHRDAKRVIVRAIKDRKTPARLRESLLLQNADDTYTQAADNILRGGAPIL